MFDAAFVWLGCVVVGLSIRSYGGLMSNSCVPQCHRCNSVSNVVLRYNITASKTNQYFWYCASCECITPIPPQKMFLPHSLIKSWNLPDEFYEKALIKDNSNENPCAVHRCKNVGTEHHHFAPVKMWGNDAGWWPTAYLCKYHHRLWHDVINGVKFYTGDPMIEMCREEMKDLSRSDA